MLTAAVPRQAESAPTSNRQPSMPLVSRQASKRASTVAAGSPAQLENLQHALALQYVHYNFVRIHKTLRCTPAMEAGIADRLWTCADIAALLEQAEAKRAA